MKIAWNLILHLLGLGCLAADILIIGSIGQFDLQWTGWVAVAFCLWLAFGVAMGWRRLVGQPLSLIVIGFYLMAVMALLGFGFSNVLGQPTLLMAFAPLAVAILGKIIFGIVVTTTRKPEPLAPAPAAAEPRKSLHDSLF